MKYLMRTASSDDKNDIVVLAPIPIGEDPSKKHPSGRRLLTSLFHTDPYRFLATGKAGKGLNILSLKERGKEKESPKLNVATVTSTQSILGKLDSLDEVDYEDSRRSYICRTCWSLQPKTRINLMAKQRATLDGKLEGDVEEEEEEEEEEEMMVPMIFGNHGEQKKHFQSDHHHRNLQRRLHGLPPLSQEQYQAMYDEMTEEQRIRKECWCKPSPEIQSVPVDIVKDTEALMLEDIEGENSSIEQDEMRQGSPPVSTEPDDISISSNKEWAKSFGQRNIRFVQHEEQLNPFQFFTVTGSDEIYSIYHRLLMPFDHGESNAASAAVTIEDRFKLGMQELFLPLIPGSKCRYWTLIHYQAGYFAGAVVDITKLGPDTSRHGPIKGAGDLYSDIIIPKEAIVAHKTFHRYVVRRKQGKAQGNQDATSSWARSIGSQIRREQQAKCIRDIQNVLFEWRTWIEQSHRIFLTCTKSSQSIFYALDDSTVDSSDSYLLRKADPRIRAFPFSLARPSHSTLVGALRELLLPRRLIGYQVTSTKPTAKKFISRPPGTTSAYFSMADRASSPPSPSIVTSTSLVSTTPSVNETSSSSITLGDTLKGLEEMTSLLQLTLEGRDDTAPGYRSTVTRLASLLSMERFKTLVLSPLAPSLVPNVDAVINSGIDASGDPRNVKQMRYYADQYGLLAWPLVMVKQDQGDHAAEEDGRGGSQWILFLRPTLHHFVISADKEFPKDIYNIYRNISRTSEIDSVLEPHALLYRDVDGIWRKEDSWHWLNETAKRYYGDEGSDSWSNDAPLVTLKRSNAQGAQITYHLERRSPVPVDHEDDAEFGQGDAVDGSDGAQETIKKKKKKKKKKPKKKSGGQGGTTEVATGPSPAASKPMSLRERVAAAAEARARQSAPALSGTNSSTTPYLSVDAAARDHCHICGISLQGLVPFEKWGFACCSIQCIRQLPSPGT